MNNYNLQYYSVNGLRNEVTIKNVSLSKQPELAYFVDFVNDPRRGTRVYTLTDLSYRFTSEGISNYLPFRIYFTSGKLEVGKTYQFNLTTILTLGTPTYSAFDGQSFIKQNETITPSLVFSMTCYDVQNFYIEFNPLQVFDISMTLSLYVLLVPVFLPTVDVQGYVELEAGGNDNVNEPFRGLGLKIHLLADTNEDFKTFFDVQDQEYEVRYYLEQTLVFVGYIEPSEYYENYVVDKYFVQINAVDGLGLLKNLAYVQNSGVAYTGKQTALEVIANCLKRIDLGLNIYTNIEYFYTGLPSVLDVTTQVFLNSIRYAVDVEQKEIKSCESVLRELLAIFGASIVQYEGGWYIYKVNSIFDGTASFYSYDADGVAIPGTGNSYGVEVLNNPNFLQGATSWPTNGGLNIIFEDGYCKFQENITVQYIYQSIGTGFIGKTILVTVQIINYVSGLLRISLFGQGTGQNITADGIYSEEFLVSSAFNGNIGPYGDSVCWVKFMSIRVVTPGTGTAKQDVNLLQNVGSQLDNFAKFHINQNQGLSLKKAVKSVKVYYKYGLLNALNPNPLLENTGGPSIPGYNVLQPTAIDFSTRVGRGIVIKTAANPDLQVIELATPIEIATGQKLQIDIDALAYGDANQTVMRYEVYLNSVARNDFYLDNNGNWVNGNSIVLEYTVKNNNRRGLFSEEQINIITNRAPTDGTINIIFHRPDTADLFLQKILFSVAEGGLPYTGESWIVQNNALNSTRSDDTITVYNGDGVSDLFEGTIYESDGITLTQSWYRLGGNEIQPILVLMGSDVLRLKQNNIKIWNGDVRGFIPYFSVIKIDKLDGVFMPIKYFYDSRNDIVSFKLKEFFNTPIANLQLTYLVEDENSNNGVNKTTIRANR